MNETTNLLGAMVQTKLTSSTRLALGLNVANQSLPSSLNSGANVNLLRSSRNTGDVLLFGPATGVQQISNRECGLL